MSVRISEGIKIQVVICTIVLNIKAYPAGDVSAPVTFINITRDARAPVSPAAAAV
jgi:hypothetical protein